MIRPTQHRRRKRRNELAERSYQRAIMISLAKELDHFIDRPCTQETCDEIYLKLTQMDYDRFMKGYQESFK